MKKVFLGGTCNGSVWRDKLIKNLKYDKENDDRVFDNLEQVS